MARTKSQIKHIQRELNAFTKRSGLGYAPLMVDGDKGHATRKRTRQVKRLLGYGKKKSNNSRWNDDFLWQLRHPRRAKTKAKFHRQRVSRGIKRRAARRKEVARNSVKAVTASGVTFYDGKPCARWLVPYLNYARQHNWQGKLVSGWRDPNYSRGLCMNMCGAPSCPGRCAGTSSNHVGSTRPQGALDVSDYARFGQIMKSCPLSPRIFNALGARDPVHFSASGR